MPFVAIDHTIAFAIDAVLKASDMQKIDQNIDYLKALMAITTGHTHDQGGTDQGGPVVPVDGSVTRDKFTAPAAGDYIIHLNADERSLTAASWTKLKEIKIGTAGTYRVKFSLITTDDFTPCYGRIYKNGAAFGTQRTATTGYVEYSEDLTFAAGDLIQVYGYDGSSGTTSVKNFKICISTPLIAGALNGY